MDFLLFFGGIACTILGYLMYRFLLKNQKPSSEETNWEGMTQRTYFGLWGCVIMSYMLGIGFILQSLPTEI